MIYHVNKVLYVCFSASFLDKIKFIHFECKNGEIYAETENMNRHSTIYPQIQSLLYSFLGSRSSKCDVPSIQTTVRVRAHHAPNPLVLCSRSTLMRNENQCDTNPFACGKKIRIGVGPSFAQFCFWLVIIVVGLLTVEATNA